MYKQASGYLYHYTTLDNFLQIWNDQAIKPTPQDQDTRPGVCLTRNSNMHLRWPYKSIKLTLDADKLNVALKPFLHQNKEDRPDFRYEAEERCYREIKALTRYLVRVDINIDPNTMEADRLKKINKIRNNLEAYNIPYELTDLSSKTLHNPEEVRQRKSINTEFLDASLLRLDSMVQSEEALDINRILAAKKLVSNIQDDVNSYIPDVYNNEKLSFGQDDLIYLRKEFAKLEKVLYDYTLLNEDVCFELKNIINDLSILGKQVGKPLNFTKDFNDLAFMGSFKLYSDKINKVLDNLEAYLRNPKFEDEMDYYEEFIGYAKSLNGFLEVFEAYLTKLNSYLRNRNSFIILKTKLINFYQRKN